MCNKFIKYCLLTLSLYNLNTVSTLGIVEAVVYILLSYYHGLDLESKKVFEYCHFLLFFTALFNVLQTCFQAYAAKACSNGLWVRSEELELCHYVAVREEFESLQEEIQLLELNSRGVSWWCHGATSFLCHWKTVFHQRNFGMLRKREL